jgi:hypothetical protein
VNRKDYVSRARGFTDEVVPLGQLKRFVTGG